MSAAKLLKNLEALPAREREKFVRAVLKLSEKRAARPAKKKAKVSRVNWPDVEARAKQIFGTRQLPNFVLLERAEQSF